MTPAPRLTGRPWRRLKARVLAITTICHICGHEGSDTLDHVVPVTRGGSNDVTNLRPAHHTLPCETCGKMCNREKTDKAWAPIVRDSGSIRRPR